MNNSQLYLVALSGGADSVALLLALKKLGYNIEAAHCNFHLRGEESDRDEDFAKNCVTNWILNCILLISILKQMQVYMVLV